MLTLRTRQVKERAYLKEFEKNMIWVPLGWSDRDCCNYYKCPSCEKIVDDWHYPANVDSVTCKCGFEGKFM